MILELVSQMLGVSRQITNHGSRRQSISKNAPNSSVPPESAPIQGITLPEVSGGREDSSEIRGRGAGWWFLKAIGSFLRLRKLASRTG